MGADNVGWGDYFGEVAGFAGPDRVVEGMFFGFCAEIFEVVDCAAPAVGEMGPEPA